MGGGEIAEIMQPAMDIGVFAAIGPLDRAEHGARLLRRGAIVEIDELPAVHLAGENGEIGADRREVERRLRRLVTFLGGREHGHRPLRHSGEMPSQSAEAVQSASRKASSSMRSIASPTKA